MKNSLSNSLLKYFWATSFCLIVGQTLALASSGTGFVVAPGFIVTNDHVIDSCGGIEIISSDGKRPAILVDREPVIDLALLRVYGMSSSVAPLRVDIPIELGEGIMIFGFPLTGALSSTGNFTTGNVSSLRGLNDSAGVIQITAPVQPGNSGGPILDDHGRVVGVVQSKLDTIRAASITGDIAQNVNFGIALPVLIDFLDKNKVDYLANVDAKQKTTVEVARDAQTFTYLVQCSSARRTAQRPAPPAKKDGPSPVGDRLTALVQIELNRLGYNAGVADGLLGPRTRGAIVAAQKALNLPQTGLPSNALLDRLRKIR